MIAKPENPYTDWRRQWSDRESAHLVAKRNWQIATLVCLLIIGGQSAHIVWRSAQSDVQPYIVQVDELRRIVQVLPAEEAGGIDDPRILQGVIEEFIFNTRTVIADGGAMKRLMRKAYSYAAQPVVTYLNAHFRQEENHPVKRAKEYTVEVENIVTLPESEKTWRVHWTETKHGLDGSPIGNAHYWALVTVNIETPKARPNDNNPLGIWFTSLSWGERS